MDFGSFQPKALRCTPRPPQGDSKTPKMTLDGAPGAQDTQNAPNKPPQDNQNDP